MAPRKKTTTAPKNAALKVQPAAPPADADSMRYLATNAASAAFGALIDHADAWFEHDGRMIYGDPNGTYLTVAPQADPEATKQAVATILAQGPEAAQSLLFLMSKDLARGPNPVGKMVIHVNEILTFKDIKKHPSGDYRTEQKLEEADRLRAMKSLVIFVDETVLIKRGRGTSMKRVKVESSLIELEIEHDVPDEKPRLPTRKSKRGPQPQISLFDPDSPRPPATAPPGTTQPYRFRISLGSWTNKFREEPSLIGSVLGRVGRYRVNQADQRIAIQIAIALMFEQKLDWTIGELLEAAKVRIPDTQPLRFRESVEAALDLLDDDGLAHWTYAEGCPPEPKYKWLPVWLTFPIQFSRGTSARKKRLANAPHLSSK